MTSELDQERVGLLDRIERAESAVGDVRLSEAVDTLMTVPLTIKQLKVLGLVVAGNGTVSAQRVATLLGVSLATVSGIVDRLVEGGVVIRRVNSVDHRVHDLTATELGIAMLKDLTASANRLRSDTLAQLEIEDLRALTQGIEALSNVLLAGTSAAQKR